MEPLMWLLAPVVVTASFAVVLQRRNRTIDPAAGMQLRDRQLRRIEAVLRPRDDRPGSSE